jgi:hypothetical protein
MHYCAGFVHLRHPCEYGGAYHFFNSIMSQLSVLVSAFLYWRYYVPATTTGHLLHAILNNSMDNSTIATDATGLNLWTSNSLGNLTGALVVNASTVPANYTFANSTSAASLNFGKIDPVSLFASVLILIAIWSLSVAGLSRMINPEYLHTFYSTQTGYAFSQSYFLDNEGNDAMRSNIFFMNERHWRSIRDRVRQWVLAMYATWQALKPIWFTDAVKAQIPDAFIPTDAPRR